MHPDLLAKRRWYTEAEYQQGLAISQTMPGPLAAQLAMWLGYLERGSFGAFVVSLPFVVPAFLFVTALAAVYAHYQGLSQVQSIFFGVGPAVWVGGVLTIGVCAGASFVFPQLRDIDRFEDLEGTSGFAPSTEVAVVDSGGSSAGEASDVVSETRRNG